MYLQINTVKYEVHQEISITYENLQIVWSQFFTDLLIFVYILSNSKNLFVYQYSDSTCSINGE